MRNCSINSTSTQIRSAYISNGSLAFSLVPVKGGALLKKSLEFFASRFLKLASEKENGKINDDSMVAWECHKKIV